MIAKKRGFCRWCEAPWRPGDNVWQRGALMTHKACMQAYVEALSQYKTSVQK